MKRILIPTDFSENSIKLLEKLSYNHDGGFDLLFTHLFYLPDGIQDLLFSTYRLREYKFVTPEFKLAYDTYIEKHQLPKMFADVPVRFFYGNTLAFFKNFLKANNINVIAFSNQFPVKKLNSSSIDIHTVINKCGVELLNVDTIEIKEKQPKIH